MFDKDRELRNLSDRLAPRKPMPKPSKRLTPKSLIKEIEEAGTYWVNRFLDKGQISRIVDEKLNDTSGKIIKSVLGIDDESFGRINLRDGPIKKAMLASLTPLVEKWVTKNLHTLPKLDGTTLDSLRESYLSEYREGVTKALRKTAAERAEKDAKQILDLVGYDPDELIKAFSDKISTFPNKKPETAPPSPHRWTLQGILKSAKVLSVVSLSEDGMVGETSPDVPDTKVWFLVQIFNKSELSDSTYATIITDGDAWYPISVAIEEDFKRFQVPVNLNASIHESLVDQNARIAANFDFKHEYIFTLMNEIDKQLILDSIATYLRENIPSV